MTNITVKIVLNDNKKLNNQEWLIVTVILLLLATIVVNVFLAEIEES
jgi:hypothetical protein